jgi:membrane protein implicated in regulation of membrane protease activity
MPSRSTTTIRQRIEEAMREIGVLLIAFGPLDAAFSSEAPAPVWWLLFLFLGLALFVTALLTEWRRTRG